MTESMTLRKETNLVLQKFLDEGTVIIGQSVCDAYGGANKVTRGCKGDIRAMPISEQCMVGYACGISMTGKTVIVEIMFANFLTLVISQIIDVAKNLDVNVIIRTTANKNTSYGYSHSGYNEWYKVLQAMGIPIYFTDIGTVEEMYNEALENKVSVIIEEKTEL